MNPRVLQSGQTPRETYDAMWAALRRGEIWQGEFVNRRKDGSEYAEWATLAPIRNDDGDVTHYVAIKDDITERKRMNQELERHRHHLEELVGTRTAQLREAQERAETANLAKSAFLANMSHEIRTPLNAIIGLTHLLAASDLAVEHAERLRKIDGSARHLLAIINDILDLSKVEAGKLRLEHLDFQLADVLARVHDSLAERAQEKGLQLTFHVAPETPAALKTDPLRLTQILLNLGTNAVKFTTEGSVALHVALEPAAVGHTLRFSVVDTGMGMSPEQVARLFQPFEQADVSTTRKFGGTGLGLAICRRLVDLLGGTIGVQSEPGQGSTFWFTLPYALPDGPTRQPSGFAEALRPLRPARPAAQVRVLLVEDDPINQEVASELMRSHGFGVEVAENGAIALQMAAATPYDAVLMDVQMPVMDGLTATMRLREMPLHATTPILAMTASAFAEDKAACLAAGMDDVLGKPIHPEAFFAALCTWTGAQLDPRRLLSPDSRSAVTESGYARVAAIPGLNTQLGLHVVQDKWPNFERLLRKYCSERADDVALLQAHAVAGRWPEAQRMAHTLKGVAATLGALDVRAGAAAVELALAHGARDAETLREPLQRLAEVHDRLVRDLCVALPPLAAGAPTLVEWEAVARATSTLQALLADDDVRALSVFRDVAPLLRAAFGARVDALERAVEAFEFEEALVQLADCQTNLPSP